MLGCREEKFVRYYTMSCDEGRAEAMSRTLSRPGVQEEVDVELARLAEQSKLNGEYVRSYLYGVLELCPTDWVRALLSQVSSRGAWSATPEEWKRVPHEVRRLVESVDVDVDENGRPTRYRIRFVSKLGALAIAAKYTLTERHEIKTSVPWEKIARAAERGVQDTIAERLNPYEAGLPDVSGADGD